VELSKPSDRVSSRIATEKIFGRYVRDGYRVLWIEWDSAFRETDLQIEDLIVALNHEPYTRVEDGNVSGSAIGQHGETDAWERAGAKDGDEIVLTVVRDGEERDIRGALRAMHFYYTPEGKQALAPGGPERLKDDGFGKAWSSWYEDVTKDWAYILCDGWNRTNLNNRKELKNHLEHGSRIEYLEQHHPGPFAQTMRADYDRVIECLRGTRYELTEDDLAYRELGEKRAEVAATAARTAWDTLLTEVASESIDTFPAADPDQRGDVVGKIVVLPWMAPRQIINDLGFTYGVVGSSREGFYFVDLQGEKAQRFYTVYLRYRALVNPNVNERYAFVARLLDDPRMITHQRSAVTGLMVEILAARVGAGEGEMFVDLRSDPPDTFAGESELKTLVQVGELADDLSPEGLIEVMIRSVQQADKETWKKTFATWRAWARQNEEIYLNRAHHLADHLFDGAFERSRRNLIKEVYDSRISKVGPILTLCEANPELGTPRLQQVTIYVDHIGLFDEEYRAFNNVNVTRPWTLQRLGNGPWRIGDVQNL
jgi:hypothetical protein